MQTKPIRGVAAGVPFLAVPPESGDPAAPLVVVWHLMDAPRTEVAMAAALPLAGVQAWRVYLTLPFAGARMPAGGVEEIFARVREDTLLLGLGVSITQAAEEFPAVLAALKEQLPINDVRVVVIGGSAGGAAALLTFAEATEPIVGAVAINAAIRAESVVALTERSFGVTYTWSEASRRVAERLDFVARAGEFKGRPVLIVSGEEDHADFQADALALADALGRSAELAKVPGLAHPLAAEPGLEAAPQTSGAKAVDALVSEWVTRVLTP